MDQQGKVAKPARGQLNRGNEVPLLQMHPSVVSTYYSSTYYCLRCLLFIYVHVFILYGYMYVAPQDESCRYCYDL